MPFQFDPLSLTCFSAQPCELVRSSRRLDWTDTLVDIQRGRGRSETFETQRTGDLSLVVKLKGRASVRVLKGGRWHHAVYDVGSAGLTPKDDTNRLQFETSHADAPFEMAHVYLAQALIDETAEAYRRIGALDSAREMNALVFRDETLNQIVVTLTRAMLMGAPNLYAEQACSFLSAHLLARHAAWWDADTDDRTIGHASDRRLARAIEFMSSSLASSLSLAEISAEAGMSRHHFLREFRRATGTTPFNFLKQLRLELAQRLLRTTEMSIAEVGRRCGFPHPSGFSDTFARQLGATPNQYRLSHRS